MSKSPSTRELVEEMEQALRQNPMTPAEHWEFLIQRGIIDREGKVLVNKYFRTDLDESETGNGTPSLADASKKEVA